MKKILLILAIFTTLNSYSQTEKGKTLIGGAISLSGFNQNYSDTSQTKIYKSFGYQITPSIGKFIKDNFAIGANLLYNSTNNTSDYHFTIANNYGASAKTTLTKYGAGIFARYYKKIINNLYFSVNAGISYTYQTVKFHWTSDLPNFTYPTNDPQNQQTNTYNYGISIVPALEYFVTPKFGIRTNFSNLYYTYSIAKNTTFSNNNKQVNSTYALSLNLSTFSLGMYYYF